MNLQQMYGEIRNKRAIERQQLELKYLEGLLFLQNEDVDEWIEICNKIHDGEEIIYPLKEAVVQLGMQVKERDRLLEEIKEIKLALGLIPDDEDCF